MRSQDRDPGSNSIFHLEPSGCFFPPCPCSLESPLSWGWVSKHRTQLRFPWEEITLGLAQATVWHLCSSPGVPGVTHCGVGSGRERSLVVAGSRGVWACTKGVGNAG